jgi:archaellum biogenesis protein FlaJ (TadC family)
MNILSLQGKLTSTNLNSTLYNFFFFFSFNFFFFLSFCSKRSRKNKKKKKKKKKKKTHQKAHHRGLLAYSLVAVLEKYIAQGIFSKNFWGRVENISEQA